MIASENDDLFLIGPIVNLELPGEPNLNHFLRRFERKTPLNSQTPNTTVSTSTRSQKSLSMKGNMQLYPKSNNESKNNSIGTDHPHSQIDISGTQSTRNRVIGSEKHQEMILKGLRYEPENPLYERKGVKDKETLSTPRLLDNAKIMVAKQQQTSPRNSEIINHFLSPMIRNQKSFEFSKWLF